MPESNVAPGCPIARGVGTVGDAWSMLILRDAHVGVTRFDQFRKNLGIAPTMLTKRLAALTQAGLLEKRLYSERPPREEYVLTPAGEDFLPVLLLFGEWAELGEGMLRLEVRACSVCRTVDLRVPGPEGEPRHIGLDTQLR